MTPNQWGKLEHEVSFVVPPQYTMNTKNREPAVILQILKRRNELFIYSIISFMRVLLSCSHFLWVPKAIYGDRLANIRGITLIQEEHISIGFSSMVVLFLIVNLSSLREEDGGIERNR